MEPRLRTDRRRRRRRRGDQRGNANKAGLLDRCWNVESTTTSGCCDDHGCPCIWCFVKLMKTWACMYLWMDVCMYVCTRVGVYPIDCRLCSVSLSWLNTASRCSWLGLLSCVRVSRLHRIAFHSIVFRFAGVGSFVHELVLPLSDLWYLDDDPFGLCIDKETNAVIYNILRDRGPRWEPND